MELSGFNAWGIVNIIAVLLISLLVANILKRRIPLLKKSLIPTSVLAGSLLLIISSIYTIITGEYIFELEFFGSPSKEALAAVEAGIIDANDLSLTGLELLEIITYHALALGFIATAFKPVKEKLSKERSTEIFNSGITTVATYLLQAVIGITVTTIAVLIGAGKLGLTNYAGILVAFGFGQGTGQAMNFGHQYETINQAGGAMVEGAETLAHGLDFGLSIASLGFISAAIGGVIFLNILRRRTHKKSQMMNSLKQ